MAKGLRASVKKNNRTKLRSSVFGPVEAARAERLHAKLLETISQPKPEAKKADTDVDSADSTKGEAQLPKEMELEDDGTHVASSSSNKKRINKSKLKKLRKPRNSIAFPATHGKGALKPFSESRVRKTRRK